MVRLRCLKGDCEGTMNMIGTALNGTLFYWCPNCERLFIVSGTALENRTEYQMKAWQPPSSIGSLTLAASPANSGA